MTQITVNPTSDIGYLESKNAVYATAAAGSTLSVNTYGADELVIGQDFATATYWLYEAFMAFDTSAIPDGAVIDSVVVRLSGLTPDRDDTPFTYNLYSGYSWGTLTTADWRTTAQLAGLTLRATVASTAWTTADFDMTDISMASAINKTGLTELVLTSSRVAAATVPSGREYTNLDATASSPQLIIDYHTIAEFDARTTSSEWRGSVHGTPNPFTFSHSPVGTPAGVVVFTVGGMSTDIITGVTYGGVAMARPTTGIAQDTLSEPGNVTGYFLANPPAGPQTVSITYTDDAQYRRSVAITVTSGTGNSQVVASGATQENIANPTVTLDSGSTTAIRLLALWSGTLNASVSVGAGLTSDMDFDSTSASQSMHAGHQTTPGSGSTALGYTIVASDDVALLGIAVAEAAAIVSASDSFGAMGFFG